MYIKRYMYLLLDDWGIVRLQLEVLHEVDREPFFESRIHHVRRHGIRGEKFQHVHRHIVLGLWR